jgi:hypothetical protein
MGDFSFSWDEARIQEYKVGVSATATLGSRLTASETWSVRNAGWNGNRISRDASN